MAGFDMVEYVRYNNWATERLLAAADTLTEEQLNADAQLANSSAFETLRHTLDVQWSWTMACQGQRATQMLWEVVPLDDLAAVTAFWREENGRLLEYVQSLSDEDLSREMKPSWQETGYQIGHILIHLINHGTIHRSEIASYFSRLGHSPGDLDFLDSLAGRS